MKIKFLFFISILILFSVSSVVGQRDYNDEDEERYDYGTYIGVKGGLSLTNQVWQSQVTTDIIFAPGVDIFSESYDAFSYSSLYAQLGYHQRGSGLGFSLSQRFATYRFHNISLELGGKRIVIDKETYDGYWLIGIRGEYTVGTNLSSVRGTSIFNIVDDEFVRKFNYGLSVGGGFERELDHQQVVFVELVFSPDLSAQYDQPFQLGPIENPFNTAQPIFIDPQKVRNYSLELKVGYKWLR